MTQTIHTDQRNPIRDFYTWLQGINPSVFLFLAAVLAIIFANSGLAGFYNRVLSAPVTLEIWGYNFFEIHGRPMTVAEFINDALMALFFFSVGLEIKKEMTIGALSNIKNAMLPVLAAIGGMIFPVLVFLTVCHTEPAMRGMAIPMATDIAFALAVLGLLGKRVPVTLKIFLMTLAVVDDIGGILVIAIFYSSGIKIIPLLIGIAFLIVSYLLGRSGVVRSGIYYLIFVLVWSFFLHSGIHTTIAGVLLALTIPHKPTIRPRDVLDDLKEMRERMLFTASSDYEERDFLAEEEIEDIRRTERRLHRLISPVQVMETQVSNIVNYLVLPLFAFANSGVTFGAVSAETLMGLPLAIFLGLLVGKLLGIFGFTYLFIKLKVLKPMPGMTPWNVLGVSLLGGIGFTVSLFIATLAYQGLEPALMAELLNQAKLGIFAGTLVSGIMAYFVLRAILNYEKKHNKGAYSQEYKDFIAEATA